MHIKHSQHRLLEAIEQTILLTTYLLKHSLKVSNILNNILIVYSLNNNMHLYIGTYVYLTRK